MSKQIFISLPVVDLSKSVAFFTALGFSTDPRFTGEAAACIAISEAIYVMLMPREKFGELSPKPICDPATAEVLLAITCESRAQVD